MKIAQSIALIFGSTVTGMGLGLWFGQAGFGLITGLGIGLILWSLLIK